MSSTSVSVDETLGAFHLVKISGSALNGTRFVGSSHWKIPRKSGKSKKVGLFSRLEFPNGMSCSIYVSRSLYQFQVHGRAPPRTGVYDQMEQLFTNRKFHFCSHWNFRVFFLNGKRPLVILLGLLIRQVRLKLSCKSMSNLPSLLFVSIRLRLRSPMRITVCFWSSAHMHNDVILSWVHLQACNFFELWKQKAVVGKEVYFWRVKDVNNSHLSPNKLLLGTTYFAPQKHTLLQ